jgi:hypothetical protein
MCGLWILPSLSIIFTFANEMWWTKCSACDEFLIFYCDEVFRRLSLSIWTQFFIFLSYEDERWEKFLPSNVSTKGNKCRRQSLVWIKILFLTYSWVCIYTQRERCKIKHIRVTLFIIIGRIKLLNVYKIMWVFVFERGFINKWKHMILQKNKRKKEEDKTRLCPQFLLFSF